MRVAKLTTYLVLPAVLAICLLTCTQSEREGQLTVGAIVAKTGSADFIGKPEEAVLQALDQDYRASSSVPPRFGLRILDSGGQPEQAKSLFRSLALDPDVIAVIGPSTSGESLAVVEDAEQFEIPLLSLAASAKIVRDESGATRRWVFKFAQNDSLAAERLARTMIEKKQSSVALIYSDDGFGKSGAEAFRVEVKQTGLRIVHDAPYPADLQTPEPIAAAIPTSANAILIWGTAPGPALVIKSLKENGHPAQIYLSHGNASDSFISTVGSAGEGAIIVGSRVLTPPDLLNQSNPHDRVLLHYHNFWRDRFGGTPSHFGGHARDAFEALVTVVTPEVSSERDSRKRRSAIRTELGKLTAFAGVTGMFTFTEMDHAGLSADAFEVYKIRDGKFVPLRALQ